MGTERSLLISERNKESEQKKDDKVLAYLCQSVEPW